MSALIRTTPSRAFFPFDRFFEDFFTPMRRGDEDVTVTTSWMPAADIRETDEALIVELELAGVKKEDVGVSLEQNVLSVTGERRHESEEAKQGLHRVERFYGQFSRFFRLPHHVEPGMVKASMKDGVLRLELPKTAEARPRQIAIN
jgi:HSP20 family protein